MVARTIVAVMLATALARHVVDRPQIVEQRVEVACDAAWFAPVVTVTKEAIVFDGHFIARGDALFDDSPIFYIDALDERLKALNPPHARTTREIARDEATRRCDSTRAFCPGRSVVVRLARDTRPLVMHLVFHTIKRNGYDPVVVY